MAAALGQGPRLVAARQQLAAVEGGGAPEGVAVVAGLGGGALEVGHVGREGAGHESHRLAVGRERRARSDGWRLERAPDRVERCAEVLPAGRARGFGPEQLGELLARVLRVGVEGEVGEQARGLLRGELHVDERAARDAQPPEQLDPPRCLGHVSSRAGLRGEPM
jgi:hypothetical protein